MEPTKLICPHCGAEFKISEKEHVAVGLAIGEDSGLGTIEMPLKKPGNRMTAEDRLSALKAAGFDTSGLFALKGAAGEDCLVRTDGQSITKVDDDDPVIKAIIESGTVPEKRLFRRWVTAQMFRILKDCDASAYRREFDRTIRRRKAKYMWETALEEFRVQMVIAKKDPDALEERKLFFSRSVAVKMTEHYLYQLKKVYKRNQQLLAGKYPRSGERVYKISRETCQKLRNLAEDIKSAKTPRTLYQKMKKFNALRVEFNDESICDAWLDAFRAAGAYYTTKNLILFSGMVYHGHRGEDAAEALYKRAYYFISQGFKFKVFEDMLETFKTNKLDIKKKRAQWARTASARKSTQAPAQA